MPGDGGTASPSTRRCLACGITKKLSLGFPPLRLRGDGSVRQPTTCRECIARHARNSRAAQRAARAAEQAALIALASAR